MTEKQQAWEAITATAQVREDNPRRVLGMAYRLASEITGMPWSACGINEWRAILDRLGGGA